jgi:YhcH/YjgK/YiaL family protein
MICGKLNDFEAMHLVSLGSAIVQAVTWIRNLPAGVKEGRYPLEDDGLYALVLSYATGPEHAARFETHRRYADLQYTVAGAEGIDWAPRASLACDGHYSEEKDLLYHQPGPAFSRVINAAGFFSFYTPVDAHRPMIRLADHPRVLKVVVKIPVSRLGIA